MKRLIALILCLLPLAAVLCGCGEMTLPASILPQSVAIELTGEYPYELPVIVNASWADEANIAIAAALTPLTDTLKTANSDETVACTAYELHPSDDGGHLLAVYVNSASSNGSIRLTEIAVSPDGEVTIPEYPIPEYMADGDHLNGYLRLSSYGIDLALPDSGVQLTTAEICRVLVDYYEAYTGSEADTSQVRLQSEDEYFLKSIALELCYGTYDYEDNSFGVYISQQNSMLKSLMESIFTDYLGRSSLHISDDDLTAAIDLYFRLYFSSPINGTPRTVIISGSDLSDVDGIEGLSRHEIALVFNAIFEHCFGELETPDEYFFTDYATDALETSYYMSFIDSFPSYALASCDFCPREYQLFSLVEYYANTCYWNQWSYDNSENTIDSKALISMLGWIDSYLDRFEPPAGGAVVVDNSRNYQWYFAQFNTGAYSDVNCMPTITAMGIKWYDADSSVTVGELRELWLPDYDGGWYMSQVADSLEYYDIPFEWHDTTESITEQLDQGHIVLSQMSEAAFDASGHCFIIYGYRRLGDSVQFMVHDPGLYDGLDEFGKPPGEAMLLDSAYVQWIIERMTFSYITIG